MKSKEAALKGLAKLATYLEEFIRAKEHEARTPKAFLPLEDLGKGQKLRSSSSVPGAKDISRFKG